MRQLTQAEAIELFHLAFLGVLPTRVDPKCYVLKGGANLRYFFDSVRYSEDIDLDVNRLKKWQLEQKVDAVLNSVPLERILRISDLVLDEFTKPKQTSTTQRWKIKLTVGGHSAAIRTKIELSHREGDSRYQLDYVPDRIINAYATRPVSAQHYEASAALEQKVLALASRSETQARDVFDLDLLMRRGGFTPPVLGPQAIAQATDRAFELPFDAFRDQVVRFLEPEMIELYDSQEVWERMQTYVADGIESFQ